MADELHEILKEIGEGRLPSRIPSDCPYAADLEKIIRALADLQQFANALASGDLSQTIDLARGPLAGSLTALQTNLRHLTGQMEKIVQGDFSQRAEFMADFSEAFNRMAEKMATLSADLQRASTHDALTGLYNRAFFDAEIERLSKGRQFPSSVVIIDVDGLKTVNETLGSAAGDQLLLTAAGLLLSSFRGEDIVARLGGDEFGIILPGVGEAKAADILNRIRATLHTAGRDEGPALSLSMGTATALSGKEISDALQLADERMSKEKAGRKIFEM